MDDKADPSTGWPIWEVRMTPSVASRDVYGKLFEYLHGVMLKFLERLNTGKVSFELYVLDVRELPQQLAANMFDRIEVSISHFL